MTVDQAIVAALEGLSAAELDALRASADAAPGAVPGLMAYIEHAVGWELDRRDERVYRLAAPMDAIPPEEAAASVMALAIIGASFADGSARPEVRAFLDAVGAAIAHPAQAGASQTH
jgi:hypothetical protein